MTTPLFKMDYRRGADVDASGRYRYLLWRRTSLLHPFVLWVMFNPSTADADQDDPTIRRCAGFTGLAGYGSFEVVNLFAWRATDWRLLKGAPDPVGPKNNAVIAERAAAAELIVLAWGDPGGHVSWQASDRAKAVVALLKPWRDRWRCLGLTKNYDQPRHPLFVRADRRLMEIPRGRM